MKNKDVENTYTINLNRSLTHKSICQFDMADVMKVVGFYCAINKIGAKIYNNQTHACVARFDIQDNTWDIKKRTKLEDALCKMKSENKSLGISEKT